MGGRRAFDLDSFVEPVLDPDIVLGESGFLIAIPGDDTSSFRIATDASGEEEALKTEFFRSCLITGPFCIISFR